MKKNKGFTLVELIVVIVIIVVLAAVSIPKFIEAKRKSDIVKGKIVEEQDKNMSDVGKVLMGEHELKLMFYDVTDTDIEEYYFLKTLDGNIFFKWKMNDGIEAISKLPLDKIRIVHENVTKPTIKFRWGNTNVYVDDLPEVFTNAVIYAIIKCEVDHWKLKDK